MRKQFVVESLENRICLSDATALAKPVNASFRDPSGPITFAGKVWFTALEYRNSWFRDLWNTDGSTTTNFSTTVGLTGIDGTVLPTNPVAGGRMYFVNNKQLWVTDGSVAGTYSLKNNAYASSAQTFANAADSAGRYYYLDTGSTGHQELYVTDGTLTGTHSLTDSLPAHQQIYSIVGAAGNYVYFYELDNNGKYILGRTDGVNVTLIGSLNAATGTPGDIQQITPTRTLISAGTPQGNRLYVTDGTAGGTHMLDYNTLYRGGLNVYHGQAYFMGSDGIYRTDSTRLGTTRIATDAGTGMTSAILNDRLYMHPMVMNEAHPIYSIDANGTLSSFGSMGNLDFIVDGNLLWTGNLSQYISASDPLKVSITELTFGSKAGYSIPFAHLGNSYYMAYTDEWNMYRWNSTATTTGTIEGFAQNDFNRNGIYEPGEPVVANSTLTATFTRGSLTTTQEVTTDAAGIYQLTLPLGTYTNVSLSNNRTTTSLPVASVTLLTPNQVVTDANIMVSSGTRTIGYVYNDTDVDGKKDANESYLANVRVFVDANADGLFTPGETYRETDTNGMYIFPELTSENPASYILVEPPSGYHTTNTPNFTIGSIDNTVIGLFSGPTFGVTNSIAPGQITVRYYIDLNNNNVQDADETALTAEKLGFFSDTNNSGMPDASEYQALLANGASTTNLPVGMTNLRVVPPNGWTTSLTDNTLQIDVLPGQTVIAPLFSIHPIAGGVHQITGTAYSDFDFSGTQTVGDFPQARVLVWADVDNDSARDFNEPWDLTDLSGKYILTGLSAGTYKVRDTVRTGLSQSPTASPLTVIVPASGGVTGYDFIVNLSNATARISGEVRLDSNNNGIFDAADQILQGVRINIGYVSNAPVDVGTDSTGKYSTYVSNGTYKPTVIAPSGYTVLNPLSASFGLAFGQTKDNLNFLLSGPATPLNYVSGIVYNDKNWSGTIDVGESVSPNVVVFDDANNNSVKDTTELYCTTDSSGYYQLAGLSVGTHKIRIVTSSGVSIVTPSNGVKNVTVAAGDNLTGQNVGISSLTSPGVSGTVFVDYNLDGIKQTADGALSGVTVWIDVNHNGVFDGIDRSTTTSSTGAYSIPSPVDAALPLHINHPAGYQSSNAPGGIVTLDTTSGTKTFSFGLYNGTGVITGITYQDSNKNGLPDASETRYNPMTVTLTNLATNQTLTTITTSISPWQYRFDNLAPGNYLVTATRQNEYLTQGIGGYSVTVTPNSTNQNLDFGFYDNPAVYTGMTFFDNDADGVYQPTDTPLAGVKAFLDLNYDNLWQMGEPYSFSDTSGNFALPPVEGSGWDHYISFQNPSGLIYNGWLSLPRHGLSSQNLGAISFTSPAIEYGRYISGYVYHDSNRNGIRDAGEAGIPNAEIKISNSPSSQVYRTDYEGFYALPFGSSSSVKSKVYADMLCIDPGVSESKYVPMNGSSVTNVNFGYSYWSELPVQDMFSISGTAWNDANANGMQDTGEPINPAATIFIDANNNTVLDAGETSTTTAGDGSYTLGNLIPGSYRVRQMISAGQMASYPSSGYQLVNITNDNVIGKNFGQYVTTFNGTSGSDNYQLQVNGSKFDIYINSVLAYSIEQSTITALSFNGNGGNDTLQFQGSSPMDAISISAAGTINHTGKTFNYVGFENLQLQSGDYTITADLGAVHLQVANASATFTQTQNLSSLELNNGASVISASINAAMPAMVIGDVTINDAMLAVAPNGGKSGTSIFGSIAITGTGKLDLSNNDLIIDYGTNATPYETILNLIQSGMSLLGGNGTGIASSEVDNQTLPGTMLALVDNGTIGGQVTSLNDVSVPTNAVLIKYTWFGDSNLDGAVDRSDYALIDTGFTSGGTLTGWIFGDYDYNNLIDGSDFALIDTGFISHDRVL